MTKIIAVIIFAAALVLGTAPSFSTPRYEYYAEWPIDMYGSGLACDRAGGYIYVVTGWWPAPG